MDKEKNLATQANDDEDPPAQEDYLDFELEIGAGSGRIYPVAVVRSAAGEAREMMQFPLDDLALENQLLTLQNALLRSGGKPRHILMPEEQSVQDFGLTLFNTLFTGAIGNCYAVSRREATLQGKGLRVKLRILSAEMAAIPWEYLYDPSRAEYVCLSRNTPVVRYLELPQPPQPLPVTLPLRVLGMIATPTNLPPLDVKREQERMEKALEPLQQRGLVQLTWLTGQTWRDVQQAMRGGTWHIFHFIGHGSFDPLSDEGLIAFADDQGQADLFRATQLARLLADHRSLRLVVLNACESAKGGRHDVFSSAAANLVRHGIPAVLAMQYTITDAAAIVFSRAFYEALADGMPIDAAVSEARKAVCFDVENTLEWGIPVLFMRSPDGMLFTVNQRGTSTSPQPVSPVPAQVEMPVPKPLPQPSTPSAVPSQPKPRPVFSKFSRRRLILVSALVLLVLILVGGVVLIIFVGPGSPGTAKITITPVSRDVKNSFVILAVTGTPDTNQRQVGARLLSSSTPSQSRTVRATGVKITLSTQAKGTLTFYNYSPTITLFVRTGTTFLNDKSPNIQMMLDAAVTVPATTGGPTKADAPAHVVQIGTIGNIGVTQFVHNGAIDPNTNRPMWSVENDSPFSGGTEGRSYTFVQQSDIDGAANPLIAALTSDAQKSLQVRSNERLIGSPQCKPNVSSDHVSGDRATSVTVTVAVTCTGEVYDQDAALSMAAKLLRAQAATDPGTTYVLAGSIATILTQATLSDARTGTIKLMVSAEGIWAFSFSDVQKRSLAKLIAGKSKKDAQYLLSTQKGVDGVDIQVEGGDGNNLPTDPSQITIIVQSVPRARITGTPTY